MIISVGAYLMHQPRLPAWQMAPALVQAAPGVVEPVQMLDQQIATMAFNRARADQRPAPPEH
jgi:hypothetical protein